MSPTINRRSRARRKRHVAPALSSAILNATRPTQGARLASRTPGRVRRHVRVYRLTRARLTRLRGIRRRWVRRRIGIQRAIRIGSSGRGSGRRSRVRRAGIGRSGASRTGVPRCRVRRGRIRSRRGRAGLGANAVVSVVVRLACAKEEARGGTGQYAQAGNGAVHGLALARRLDQASGVRRGVTRDAACA